MWCAGDAQNVSVQWREDRVRVRVLFSRRIELPLVFSFAAELWLWRSRLNVFFFPSLKLAVSAGVSCFCFWLFHKEVESNKFSFFGSRILYQQICLFVASWSLFSKFKTIHGFGPSIRSSFVLAVLRFCN